jgi:hypothetical protein
MLRSLAMPFENLTLYHAGKPMKHDSMLDVSALNAIRVEPLHIAACFNPSMLDPIPEH